MVSLRFALNGALELEDFRSLLVGKQCSLPSHHRTTPGKIQLYNFQTEFFEFRSPYIL